MYNITKDTLIADVLNINPDAAPIFIGMGMHCLGCAMASGETIAEACVVHGVDADEFLGELNKIIGE